MKTKIIPAINSQNFEDIKNKINLLKDLVSHFHLDVASFEFTGYSTWKNPEDLNKLGICELSFDLHLMLSLKPQEILKWQKENVKSFIFHLEASPNPDALLKIAKRIRRKIFIAWSPKVEFEFIGKYLKYVDGVLVLGVNPGRAGQAFLEEIYSRLEFIKSKLSSKQKLMVDGGINKENFHKILEFEPDFIVMASAIYNSENPKETYQWFLNQIKN